MVQFGRSIGFVKRNSGDEVEEAGWGKPVQEIEYQHKLRGKN